MAEDEPLPALKTQPLYEQVHELLMERIVTGHYQTGAFLPKEYELAEDFGVSIGTIKKAMLRLVEKRLVERIRGSGTRVANVHALHRKLTESPFRFGTTRQPIVSQQMFLACETIDCPLDVAGLLEIEAGCTVIRIARQKWIPGKKIAVYESYMPAEMYPEMPELEEDRTDPSWIAQINGIFLQHAWDRVSAISADQETAEVLQLSEGLPLIQLMRLFTDQSGRPAELQIVRAHLRDGYYVRDGGDSGPLRSDAGPN